MALDGTIKVTGSKQGAFAHQNPIKSRAGTSVVLGVEWEVEAPRDQHTGLAVGKREHHPIHAHIPLDSSAINFKTSVAFNEVLTTVMFQFFQSATATLNQAGGAGGMGGEAKPYYTIELKNAVVASVKFVQPWTRSVDPEIKNKDIYIRVGLTYQSITATWVEGGKTWTDDWTSVQ